MIRVVTKFPMQCVMSNGIPDVQYAIPAPMPPAIKYGIAHNAPKISPYAPATTAQIITD